jgi:VCBS repeat protein
MMERLRTGMPREVDMALRPASICLWSFFLSLPLSIAGEVPGPAPWLFPEVRYSIDDFALRVMIEDMDLDGLEDLVVLWGYSDRSVSIFPGLRTGGFGEPKDYPLPGGPEEMAVGDLNRDGRPDLVFAGYDGIKVLIALSRGGFAAADGVPTASVDSLALGDLNGDRRIDVVAGTFASNDLSVLLAQPSGKLGAETRISTGTPVASIAIADLDRDGKADLIVACQELDEIRVYPGLGGGRFASPTSYPVHDSPVSVALADLEGDGLLDVVVANRFSTDIAVLRGVSSGGLGEARFFPAGFHPTYLAIGDVDGDAKTDAVVANEADPFDPFARPSSLSFLAGRGDGSFDGPRTQVMTFSTFSIVLGDMNRDGLLDVAAVNGYTASVSIHLTLPGGGWPHWKRGATGGHPEGIVLADLDGDGRNEVAAAGGFQSSEVSVFEVDAAGQPLDPVHLMTGPYPAAIAAGDVTGDGRPDLVVGITDAPSVSVFAGVPGGGFAPPAGQPISKAGALLALGDLDGDGFLDALAASRADDFGPGNPLSFLPGLPGGGLGPERVIPGVRAPSALAIGDLDRDGRNDIAVTGFRLPTGNVSVLLSSGPGEFVAPVEYPCEKLPTCLLLHDLDGDGLPEALTGHEFGTSLSIFPGLPGGALGPARSVPASGYLHAIALADVDGDGLPDLVGAGSTQASTNLFSKVTVLRGLPDGSFSPPLAFATGKDPRGISVGDLDGDGWPDVATANSEGADISVLRNLVPLLSRGDPLAPFVRGDANGDGAVDLSDPIRILFALFASEWLPCDDAADADDSGFLDLADPVRLLAHLFLGGAAPPAPGPDCGAETTLDPLGCLAPGCL